MFGLETLISRHVYTLSRGPYLACLMAGLMPEPQKAFLISCALALCGPCQVGVYLAPWTSLCSQQHGQCPRHGVHPGCFRVCGGNSQTSKSCTGDGATKVEQFATIGLCTQTWFLHDTTYDWSNFLSQRIGPL